ncbi:MAG: large-conductance mechanosensitive channel protein MscL [Peptostreptococcaceae bacterium]|nr:large-conductance mechanosensitive channel protein MscL [Peptostreptococcaceae bacterium]
MLKEFKEFALKGNVLDLAVAVIIGGAFGKIVSSLVNDIFMPIIGFLTAGTDFSALKLVLSPAVVENGEVIKAESAILYGSFIQNIIDFLIIAFCIFMFVKLLNSMKKKEEPAPEAAPETSEDILLLRDIKGLLEKQNTSK